MSTPSFKAFFDLSPDLMCICTADGSFVELNSAWQRLLGRQAVELRSQTWFDAIHPNDRDTAAKIWQLLINGSTTLEQAQGDRPINHNANSASISFQARLRQQISQQNNQQNYQYIPIDWQILVNADGVVNLLGRTVDRDSERRNSNKNGNGDRQPKLSQLAAPNSNNRTTSEEDFLFKEIHHRVKNNLQIVSSLLDLQAQQVADPQVRELFYASQLRIHSMALIHENLYQAKYLDRIDMNVYVAGLLKHIRHSYLMDVNDVAFEVAVEPIYLVLDLAIPCGLIINELVTNGIKHAFAETLSGTIAVSLVNNVGDRLVLKIGNDGKSFPQDFDIASSDSLGLQLVDVLVDQLGGSIELEANGGSMFIIEFPQSLSTNKR